MSFFPRGLRRVRIWNYDGSGMTELDAAQSLGLKPGTSAGELRGNDQVVDSFANISHVDIDGSDGGLSFDAMAVLTGSTVTTSGATPNRVRELRLIGGSNLPYFKMAGISATTAGGAMHVYFPKVQVQTMPNGTMQDENYFVSGWAAKAIADNGTIVVIQELETLAELPDTFPAFS